MRPIRYISWLALVLALVAWALLGYFAWAIYTGEGDRVANMQMEEQSSSEGASALRMHAIAQDTAREREKLTALVAIDVVSAAGQIESVGKAAGIEVKLGNALPEVGTPAQENARVQTIGFTIQAEGKFSALMRTAELLQTLPLASHVDRLDIQRAPGETAAKWRMNVYIKVLTSGQTPS